MVNSILKWIPCSTREPVKFMEDWCNIVSGTAGTGSEHADCGWLSSGNIEVDLRTLEVVP